MKRLPRQALPAKLRPKNDTGRRQCPTCQIFLQIDVSGGSPISIRDNSIDM